MQNYIPFIHLFKTLDNYYLFDVNTNAILNIEKEIYIYLQALIGGKQQLQQYKLSIPAHEAQEAHKWVLKARADGFLSDKRIKQIRHNNDPYLEGLLNHNMGNLVLQVTQACNLRCSYCTYSGSYQNRQHGVLSMPEETALKAIDYYIAHSSDKPRLSFGFYGGEPFLNFDLIKKLANYIKHNIRGKEYQFFITTNGTIINEEIIQFLVNNDVNLFVSIDGPEEVHDKNRCFVSGKGSFNVLMKNIEMIKEYAPEYANKKVSFSTVLSEDSPFCSLSSFFTDFDTIKDPFIMASTQTAYYKKDDNKSSISPEKLRYYDDLGFETLKYMMYKQGRLQKSDISKLATMWEERELSVIGKDRKLMTDIPEVFHPSGPCTPGCNRLFVNVNGDMFPCERVSETSDACKLGTVDSGIDLDKARKILNIGKITEDECKNCWAVRYCESCVASADNGGKLDKKYKLKYCKAYRGGLEAKLKKLCTYKEFGLILEGSES